jgi:hypothetical protein
MRFSTFALLAGLIGLVFGIGFLLIPVAMLAHYGISTDPAGVLMGRFFGAALVQLGLILIFVRNVADRVVQRAISMGAAVGTLAGLAVAILGQTSGIVNTLGWSTVAIYGLLFAGYASFAWGKQAAG